MALGQRSLSALRIRSRRRSANAIEGLTVWLSRLISSAHPRSSAADRPALTETVVDAPRAQEASRAAGFTIRLSIPSGKGAGPGTVSIGQFGTMVEAEAYGRELAR